MNDKELEQHAKQALNKSEQDLSPEIRQRLFEARQAALLKQQTPWFKQNLFRNSFVGFALAASFSSVMLINYLPLEQSQQTTPAPMAYENNELDDLLFLASFDEMDIEVAENLEFAYWLSEQLENDSTTDTLSNSERHNG